MWPSVNSALPIQIEIEIYKRLNSASLEQVNVHALQNSDDDAVLCAHHIVNNLKVGRISSFFNKKGLAVIKFIYSKGKLFCQENEIKILNVN